MTRRGDQTLRISGIALLPFMLCATPAVAQVLEQITVTAQKREQNLQDVGISVTALSGDQIQQLGFENSVEVIAQTPGVDVRNVFGEFSPNTTIAIRGIAQTDFQDGHESPAVVYVDEFYVLPTAASNFSIYDLERIEALRGPQGTLFGRNATAGLVHYITKKPTQEFDAFAKLTAAEDGIYRFEGAVGGPLGDTVSARLSANVHRADGHVRNILRNEDAFDAENYALRGQLLFEPSDRTSVLLKGEFADVEASHLWQSSIGVFLDTDGFVKEIPAGADVYGTCVQCSALGFTEDGDPDVDNSSDPTGINTETKMGLLRIEHEFDSFQLTSVTGYLDLSKGVFEDACGTPLDVCRTGYYFDTEEFTQELRLNGETDSMRWTFGGFYLDQDGTSDQDAVIDGEQLDLFGLTALGLPLAPFAVDVLWDLKVKSWSLFGQLEFDVSDTVTVIAGARYTDDEKEFELVRQDFLSTSPQGSDPNRPNLGFTNLIPGFFLDGLNFTRDGETFLLFGAAPLTPAGDLTKQSWDNIAAKLAVDWRPTDDLLVFASLSRGHKAGGFNNGYVTGAGSGGSNEGLPYDEEVLHSLEVGFKSTIGGGLGRLNASVFYYDYKDHQAFSFVGIGNSIDNADGTIYGAEAEIVLNPAEGLEVLLGASVLDTELKDVANTGGVVGDHEFGLAPKFTANGVVRYEWSALNGTMAVQGDFSHVGKRFSSALNNPSLELEAYTLGNARVSYRTGDDRWSFAVFVKNIGDTRKPVYRSELDAFGGASGHIHLPPRRFGVSATFQY